MGIKNWIIEKLNPSQEAIKNGEPGGSRTTKDPYTIAQAYREIEVVNRAVNMFVDACSELTFDVKDKYPGLITPGTITAAKLQQLLNVRPNPYMDISLFKRLVFMDFLMEGHAFIYWDGSALYPLPAAQVTVVMDSKKFINKFVFSDGKEYKPNEIIFLKDNAYYNNTVMTSGFSRLSSSLTSIKRINQLNKFKENFYNNGTILGLVIETDTMLGKRHRTRMEEETSIRYNATTGKSNVLVLDGGYKAKTIANTSFKDMGTQEDQEDLRKNVCQAIGLPPILLDSGNNANIRPNLDLFYSTTVMPTLRKAESAIEFFFGFDVNVMYDHVLAMAPDKKLQADYLSALTNNGIITGDEARAKLRLHPIGTPDMTTVRIPQNIAGSGTGVTGQQGGKPPKEDKD